MTWQELLDRMQREDGKIRALGKYEHERAMRLLLDAIAERNRAQRERDRKRDRFYIDLPQR
jgi:hypothetical protein